MQKVGRNELCPCGSGDKYKRCCRDKVEQGDDRTSRFLMIALLTIVVLAALAIFLGIGRGGGTSATERVWDADHGHYHDVG